MSDLTHDTVTFVGIVCYSSRLWPDLHSATTPEHATPAATLTPAAAPAITPASESDDDITAGKRTEVVCRQVGTFSGVPMYEGLRSHLLFLHDKGTLLRPKIEGEKRLKFSDWARKFHPFEGISSGGEELQQLQKARQKFMARKRATESLSLRSEFPLEYFQCVSHRLWPEEFAEYEAGILVVPCRQIGILLNNSKVFEAASGCLFIYDGDVIDSFHGLPGEFHPIEGLNMAVAGEDCRYVMDVYKEEVMKR